MPKKRKLEYKEINGKKCQRYVGTTTWEACES